jgi:hypothetical protein
LFSLPISTVPFFGGGRYPGLNPGWIQCERTVLESGRLFLPHIRYFLRSWTVAIVACLCGPVVQRRQTRRKANEKNVLLQFWPDVVRLTFIRLSNPFLIYDQRAVITSLIRK